MNEESQSAYQSPDESLPAVTPPNARFLVRLFVIPFCIVVSVVSVMALFGWLAHQDGDVSVDIAALGRDNAYRWQAASNLADALRNPRNVALREDPATAKKLAGILDQELKKPLPANEDARQQEINVRTYLCRALGEFLVPDVVPVLVRAAGPAEGDNDQQTYGLPVRLAALEALAVVLGNAQEHPTSSPWRDVVVQIEPSLMAAADYRNEDPNLRVLATQLRMRAAFDLGIAGSPAALDRLERLLFDPSPDVRYNAAAGLARNGDARAVPLLCDMLDPNVTEGVVAETVEDARPFKRLIIYQTAILAAQQLAERNTRDPLSPLPEALDKFSDAEDATDNLLIQAKELREKLESRVTSASDAS